MNNYTPLVISSNDKKEQLTLLSKRKLALKVGTNENGSACGGWLSIGI